MSRILFVTVLLFTLTGCPFYLHAPPGGSIVSQSGTYSCAAGKTCEIPITNTNFNELFIADPAPGYIFLHWKKRNRGICAYKSGPCRITSGPFEGQPKLLRLLDTNQALNLEAVFSPTSPDDGEILKQNASACYNEELLSQGTRYKSKFQSYVWTANRRMDGGRREQDQMISGQVNFEGKPAMLSTTETRPLPSGSPITTSKEYFTTDTANKSFTTVGSGSEEQGSTENSTKQVIDPGLTTRFNVNAGETYSQTFTSSLTVINNGIPLPGWAARQ